MLIRSVILESAAIPSCNSNQRKNIIIDDVFSSSYTNLVMVNYGSVDVRIEIRKLVAIANHHKHHVRMVYTVIFNHVHV